MMLRTSGHYLVRMSRKKFSIVFIFTFLDENEFSDGFSVNYLFFLLL